MPVKSYKPTTSSRRKMSTLVFNEITKNVVKDAFNHARI